MPILERLTSPPPPPDPAGSPADPTSAEWWTARPWRRTHLRRIGLVRVSPRRARLLRAFEWSPTLERRLLPGRLMARRMERRRLDQRLAALLRELRVIFAHHLHRCPDEWRMFWRPLGALRLLPVAVGFVAQEGGPGACRRIARAAAGVAVIAFASR